VGFFPLPAMRAINALSVVVNARCWRASPPYGNEAA
jgi:hypothetical protein